MIALKSLSDHCALKALQRFAARKEVKKDDQSDHSRSNASPIHMAQELGRVAQRVRSVKQ